MCMHAVLYVCVRYYFYFFSLEDISFTSSYAYINALMTATFSEYT